MRLGHTPALPTALAATDSRADTTAQCGAKPAAFLTADEHGQSKPAAILGAHDVAIEDLSAERRANEAPDDPSHSGTVTCTNDERRSHEAAKLCTVPYADLGAILGTKPLAGTHGQANAAAHSATHERDRLWCD